MNKYKILLVDDHSVLRESLESALEGETQFEVIGHAEDGYDAIEKATSLCPDIIIMDINMPNMDGLKASRIIKSKRPDVRILALTMHENKQYVMDALTSGIDGYLLKMSKLEEVIHAIKVLVAGNNYYDDKVIAGDQKVNVEKKAKTDILKIYNITERELEVIRLLSEGFTVKEISNKLFISSNTIANHKRNIFSKMNFKNTAELIRFVYREKLFESD